MSTATSLNELLLDPQFTAAGSAPMVDLGDHRGYPLVSSQSNGGAFLLALIDVDPNGGTPPHVHAREEETFYILEGNFDFMVGEQTIAAGPGDTVFAPRNIPHAWRCMSEEGGRAVLLITPGANFEQFALGMAEQGIVPLDANCLPQLASWAEKHGITILLPQK